MSGTSTSTHFPPPDSTQNAEFNLPCSVISTSIGTLNLIHGGDGGSTGFIALDPQLTRHHAAPSISIFPDGTFDIDCDFLSPSLAHELITVLQMVNTPSNTLRFSTAFKRIHVQSDTLVLTTFEGATVEIRLDHGFFTVNWDAEAEANRWAVGLDGAMILRSRVSSSAAQMFQAEFSAALADRTGPLGTLITAFLTHQERRAQHEEQHIQFWQHVE
ncbi:hypothetical protein IHN32_00115 [Deinococcus sp. 14RED07]|uniref:hypothetical protein n=1 Tax=Deinococcus sp. 14RED07 TaxID=2745874 RepID=UPI001E3CE443|nr:hypothetical protein [Deinococcus sp. 14RED07]MCD0174361.1 hypothetical protein [Deinococcus sp. 14RED07]